jgi:hypothetical protein
MQGETPSSFNLFVRGNASSVTGELRRTGWNRQYIIYTHENPPVEWNVMAVEGQRFKIHDIE